MALNVIGIQESSFLNLLLALVDLVTQLALVILGIFLLLNFSRVISNIHLGVAPTWGNFLASISIAMVTYTGIETISNLSEEAKNPGRTVPRATFAVIAAVLFVSAFLPTIGMSVFPVYQTGGAYTTDLATVWKDDPVAGIVTGFVQPLAFWAGIWVGFLAFTILVIATNAGLIGISRLSYSMAGVNMLPKRFAALHPKFKTPYVSILIFGVAAALLVLPGVIVGAKEIDLIRLLFSASLGDASAFHRTGAVPPLSHALEHQVWARQHPRPLSYWRAVHRSRLHPAHVSEHLELDLHLFRMDRARGRHVHRVPHVPQGASVGTTRGATAARA
jgi:amino acid transporter